MPVFNNALAGAAGSGGAAAGPIKSVRFNSADSAYLNRTPSSAGNRKTFTFSFWFKKSASSGRLLGLTDATSTERFEFMFSSDRLYLYAQPTDKSVYSSSSFTTNARLRDFSAWYHVVLAVDTTQSTSTNRLRCYVNGVEQTFNAKTYPTLNNEFYWNSTKEHLIGKATGSVHFSGYMADFYFIDGQALEPTDFGAFDDNGVWQAAGYSGTFGTNGFHLFDFANESGIGDDSSGNDNDFTVNNITSSVNYTWSDGWTSNINNPTRAFDGTDNIARVLGTANGVWTAPVSLPFTTLKLMAGHDGGTLKVNNVDVTSQFSASPGSLITVTGVSSPLTSIGLDATAGTGNPRVARVVIDGETLIDDYDYPAADNDVLRDVPTNGDSSDDTGAGGELSSNYPTMNPLAKNSNTTLSNGNLDVSSTAVYTTLSTIAFPSTGKFYAEFKINDTASGYPFVGIGGFNDTAIYSNANPNTGAFYAQGGYVTGSVSVSSLTALSAGDIVGVAYDTSNGKVWFSINGTYVSSGDPANGTNATCTLSANASGYCLATSTYQAGTVSLNAGQRAFSTNAPSGFKCLCTSNLPTPTIADGSAYFEAKAYTGNGSTQTISGLEFSPDLVWLKSREDGEHHGLFDTQRGALYRLVSDYPYASTLRANTVTSFNSDGFSLGSAGEYNGASSETHIAWAWDAGSSAVSNTDGSITSSVRANQTAGFSIVTYTGNGSSSATVGHGLNASLGLLLIKNTEDTWDWIVKHKDLSSGEYVRLNADGAEYPGSSAQNGGIADLTSSSTFGFIQGVSTVDQVNKSGEVHIAYCFAPVAGYSAMGSYTGNGSSSDGPFVALSFRPALVIIKCIDSDQNWVIIDSARSPHNTADEILYANYAFAEATSSSRQCDFLSNGIKIRGADSDVNTSGDDYAFIAFAENPFQANGGLAR